MLDEPNSRSGWPPALVESADWRAGHYLIGAAGICVVEELIQ